MEAPKPQGGEQKTVEINPEFSNKSAEEIYKIIIKQNQLHNANPRIYTNAANFRHSGLDPEPQRS